MFIQPKDDNRPERGNACFPHRVAYFVLGLLLLAGIGCARSTYRHQADREAYCLIETRQSNDLWNVPARTVEPQPHSRMYLASEQDCGPKPYDDEAAKRLMDCPDGFDNSKYYSKIPTDPKTENPIWLDLLPRNTDHQIELTPTLAIDLALLHSREYQTQFENVYLTALGLSGNRFEFDAQWFGGTGTNFTATGADFGDQRQLNTTLGRLGFSRSLAGGGQFATSVLNGLFWDFGSNSVQGGSASIVTTFTQPLLRGAFRHVRLENLTQAERDLLYSVRDFARFRRLFYVDVTTSYLDLLMQVQAIRNARTNVENLRQNLIEYDFYVQLELVSQIQRDQVFQQYQNGRLSLLAAEQNLAASLDAFKFQLGLPAWVPLEVDETLLGQFELVDPKIVSLQDASQELYVSLMQFLPPERADREFLDEAFSEYSALRGQVAELLPEVEAEMDRWLSRLDAIDQDQLGADDLLDFEQQRSLADRIQSSLSEMRTVLDQRESSDTKLQQRLRRLTDAPAPSGDSPSTESQTLVPPGEVIPILPTDTASTEATTPKNITSTASGLEELDSQVTQEVQDPAIAAWEALQQAVGLQLRAEISELYITQTQIRLYLIDIDQLPELKAEPVISYAFQNRLDLMNSQARVMDAYRKVEVAADALESDLSVTGGVALGSDPNKNNAFRLDSSANRYTVGVEFDGPLNRLNERNQYRATQIAYQQAGRNYLANKDQVANDLRSVLRQLELSRLNFQIARQQVVAATRQVDQAQIDLRSSSEAEANLTLFLLQALQGVLDAKNNLVSNWVTYRIQKMRLFASLELLYLDENGQWFNEETGISEISDFSAIDPEYFPSTWFAAPAASPAVEPDAEEIEADPELIEEPADVRANEVPARTALNTGEFRRSTEGVVVPSVPYSFQFK